MARMGRDRLLATILGGLGAIATGCAVPERAPSPASGPRLFENDDLVRAKEVVVELVRFNGAELPAEPLERALRTVAGHLRGTLTLVDRGSVGAHYDERGRLVRVEWPFGAGEDGGVAGPGRFSRSDGGVVGLQETLVDDGEAPDSGDEHGLLLWPVLHRDALLILVEDRRKSDVAGFITAIPVAGSAEHPGESLRLWLREVHLFPRVVRRRARLPLVTEAKLWQWLIVHELGHALDVPVDHRRAAHRRGKHCVRPDCVMYSPADWRAVMQIVLHGRPLDFCGGCAAELVQARERPSPWPSPGAEVPEPRSPAPAPESLDDPAPCGSCGDGRR